MAEIVNLRQFRKRKAREDKAHKATQNRALHGRSKAKRAVDSAEQAKADSFLDGHFLSPNQPASDKDS
ncbi:DUF4169 family protein [Aquamicrobium segne]|uniref:DUF4169 family protein n=1 Tax=Aquamicrobium segne TaxID=469547 RepID=A0ABW0H0K1_9HYPH